ncbi:MAG: ABC-F family ATP-binding cassette domain-containing protein [Bacteroidota bacterium]
MNYLRAENLSKHYGERTLFENITISIEQGQKVALIAKNGTGKTSLLNIIAGNDIPDSGNIVISKEISIAFLEQEPPLPDTFTVWDTLYSGNNELLNIVANYEAVLELQETDHSTESLNKLQAATEDMDRMNAWDYEARVKQILGKLNIHHTNQLVSTLSGGQKKRVALAGILIHNPDFIIMDEPTNHLDVEMIEWLEGYLKTQQVTLLLVTHDRYFLDNVCTSIIELDNGRLYHYQGKYADFIAQKADREFREEREIDKAKNLLRKELEWMRRQPKARGTKSKSRIDAYYEIKEKASKRIDDKLVKLDIKTQRMGGKILEIHRINKSYGDLCVANDFSFRFKPGERVGIVGRNGVGKTAFLNMLMGLEEPDSGRITKGDTITFGYYSQKGMVQGEDKRVIEVVKDIAEYIELNKGEKITASQLLKRFLFDDKQQFVYVSKLSGGEKRRLYLLTILMKNPNFLVLDEPTNDLDISTLNVLEDFLESFKGCIMIVTHDRYFMDRIAEHLFVFEGKGNIRDFNGNYQDYLDEMDMLKSETKTERTADKSNMVALPKEQTSAKRKPSYKELREYEILGKEIEAGEERKKELETLLSSGSTNHEELTAWSTELEQLKLTIDEKELRWLELGEIV